MVFQKITTLEGSKAFIAVFFSILLDVNLRSRQLDTAFSQLAQSFEVLAEEKTQAEAQLQIRDEQLHNELAIEREN